MSIVIYAFFMAEVRVPHLKPIIAYYPNFIGNQIFSLPYVDFKYLKKSKINGNVLNGLEE